MSLAAFRPIRGPCTEGPRVPVILGLGFVVLLRRARIDQSEKRPAKLDTAMAAEFDALREVHGSRQPYFDPREWCGWCPRRLSRARRTNKSWSHESSSTATVWRAGQDSGQVPDLIKRNSHGGTLTILALEPCGPC